MLCTVGAAQAHTPSTKNYAVEIPTWSILRDLQHHMTTSVKCNGLLLPWTTALLIAVEPQPGKYALLSSPLQIYIIHKPAHLSYFLKTLIYKLGKEILFKGFFFYAETAHYTCIYSESDFTTFSLIGCCPILCTQGQHKNLEALALKMEKTLA